MRADILQRTAAHGREAVKAKAKSLFGMSNACSNELSKNFRLKMVFRAIKIDSGHNTHRLDEKIGNAEHLKG